MHEGDIGEGGDQCRGRRPAVRVTGGEESRRSAHAGASARARQASPFPVPEVKDGRLGTKGSDASGGQI